MKRKRKKNNKNMVKLRDSKIGTQCPQCLVEMGNPKKNTWNSATIEHIERCADGGLNNLNNIVIICKSCNTARGTTAQHMKQNNVLGYAEWAILSLNTNCYYSKAVIAAYFSNIDFLFWQLVCKRGISRPY